MSCAQTHIHDRALLQPGCQPHQLCSGTRPGISDKLVRPVPSSLPPWVHLEGHSHFFLPLQSSDSIFNKFSSFWANTYMRSSHGPDLFGQHHVLGSDTGWPPRQQPLKTHSPLRPSIEASEFGLLLVLCPVRGSMKGRVGGVELYYMGIDR